MSAPGVAIRHAHEHRAARGGHRRLTGAPSALPQQIAPGRPYPEPTFGAPNPGLLYPDASHYWEKVRELMLMAVSRFDYDLAEQPDLALALCGQLHLGVNLAGRGTIDATDVAITRWVSWLLTQMKARTIIGLGLVGLLVNPPPAERAKAEALRDAWDAPGGTLLDGLPLATPAGATSDGRVARPCGPGPSQDWTCSARDERMGGTRGSRHLPSPASCP